MRDSWILNLVWSVQSKVKGRGDWFVSFPKVFSQSKRKLINPLIWALLTRFSNRHNFIWHALHRSRNILLQGWKYTFLSNLKVPNLKTTSICSIFVIVVSVRKWQKFSFYLIFFIEWIHGFHIRQWKSKILINSNEFFI